MAVFVLLLSSCSNEGRHIKENEQKIQDYVANFYNELEVNNFNRLLVNDSEYPTIFVEDYIYTLYSEEYHPVTYVEDEIINRLSIMLDQFGTYEEHRITGIQYIRNLEDYGYPAFFIDVSVIYEKVQASERITLLVLGSSLSIQKYDIKQIKLRIGTHIIESNERRNF